MKVAENEYSSISVESTEKSSLYLLDTDSQHLHQNKSQCILAHVAITKCSSQTVWKFHINKFDMQNASS